MKSAAESKGFSNTEVSRLVSESLAAIAKMCWLTLDKINYL